MDVVVCGDLLYIITLAITICPIILPFTPHVSKKKKEIAYSSLHNYFGFIVFTSAVNSAQCLPKGQVIWRLA